MQNVKKQGGPEKFRRRFSLLSHLFWIAALLDALYIAGYVLSFALNPTEAAARGQLLSLVPPMVEHILMSVLLLTACGAAEESIFRSL